MISEEKESIEKTGREKAKRYGKKFQGSERTFAIIEEYEEL